MQSKRILLFSKIPLKTINYIITFLLIFIVIVKAIADHNDIDNLKAILKTSRKEQKANTLNKLAELYIYESYDTSLYYARMAFKLSKETGNKEEEIYAINNIGFVYYDQNEFEKAL